MLYLIINHATEETIDTANRDQLAESRLLDYQVKVGEENLIDLRELVAQLSLRVADAKERIETLQEEVEVKEESLEEVELVSLDLTDELEKLRAEVKTQEERVKRLEAEAESQRDINTIEIVGEGDRQYLTGLYMGGNNVLVALDRSSSMLDKTIVNILRRRNMSRERQLESPKWQRAIDTVEWLVANVPVTSSLQIATFNNQAELVLADQENWLEATESDAIRDAISSLRETVPRNGTNLEELFMLVAEMRPLPDNIFLITDGLPTLETNSNRLARNTVVSGRERLGIFVRSARSLPIGIPVNVIMLPLEGDPRAAGSYWNLARSTSGTFMTPSEDWP